MSSTDASGRRAARAAARAGLVVALAMAVAPAAFGAGYEMFSAGSFSTGEKPQSKLWFHDGSWWGALKGPDGVALYRNSGTSWVRGPVVASSGNADVRWNGTHLFVLVYGGTSRLYKYAYSAGTWTLLAGFPVNVPTPSGSETMVLDQDSTGRLWATAEGGGSIHVYYTTSADHLSWSSSSVVMQTGVNSDDISTVIAFGGNKIGVFWSDQNRDYFGFRVHMDGDAPTSWGGIETVFQGSGHADDHINLAADPSGRVYAVTKDDSDEFAVHRRGASGGWTTKTNIAGGSGTRPIIQVSEASGKAYVLYTRWGVSPERIEYRVANLSDLSFGGQTTFISSTSDMNNVTGTKQPLPAGCLMAVAENGSKALFNSFGTLPSGGPSAPSAPQNLLAALLAGPARVELSWAAPSSGTPSGYNVYRSVDGGGFAKLNGSLVAGTSYTDTSPVGGQLCYRVTAVANSLEGTESNTACVDNTPVAPPGAPQNLVASLTDPGPAPAGGALILRFDEGGGQVVNDASGNANHGQLGSSTGVDTSDPTWVAGVAGTALQFDGSNDYVLVPDADWLDFTGSFTVECWVRHNAGTGTVFEKGNATQRNYRLMVDSSRALLFRWENSGGSARTVTVANGLPDAGWHHVACVYDQAANQNRLYVDGVLRGTSNTSGTPGVNTQPLRIGARMSSSLKDELNGAVDGLRIAPGVLYSADFTPAASPLWSTPFLAKAAGGDGIAAATVYLTWLAPASGGAPAGYNVYRSANGGASAKLNTALVTTLSFADASPQEGQNCYQVTAVNAQGMEGAASNSECVDLGPPPPPPPGAPENVTAALVAGTLDSVLVQWQAPTTGSPAVAYLVSRQVGGGAFQNISGAGVAGLQFVDADAPAGTLCYRVSGLDALGRESIPSATSCLDVVVPPPPAPSPPQALQATLATTPGGALVGAGVWRFDDGTGQTATDATGNGHTGQLGTTPDVDTADPTWSAGISGKALQFDGSGDRVVVSDAADLHFAAGFTLEAWVQRGATGASHCILSKGDSQRRNYWMRIDSSNGIDFRWETASGSNHGTTSPAAILDAAWHHVACVYDPLAGQDRIYVDGILIETSTDSGTPTTSTDPLLIGTRLSSGKATDYFRGAIDLVRVTPEVLYTTDFTPPQSFAGGPPQTSMELVWQAPASGPPAGYKVYRQIDGGAFALITAQLVAATQYTDVAPPAGDVCYQVTAVDGLDQEGPPSAAACATVGPLMTVATARKPASQPIDLRAEPNPFNPSTRIVFSLAQPGRTRLDVFDVRGRRVAKLVDEARPAGVHVVRWNGRSDDGVAVASGTYFAVLRAPGVHERHKLILLK